MPDVQLIDPARIRATLQDARRSPRRRKNFDFHEGAEDNPHRFLNVMLRGTYVVPHRHLEPPKAESFLVLEGRVAVLIFDDGGRITARYELGRGADGAPAKDGYGVDLRPGVWHSLAPLTEHAVIFEVKPGPWDPATDKELAPWAPGEGEPGWEAYRDAIRDAPAASG